ncbi:hypothetical protein PAPYR_4786 [Paratrimastix pyriformis]|uniref:Calponin-homology (CH) domain-containing protein n=1 Tax=Paratrimastix pyriformis TaxID=342808 RepID=A0ABQ8UJ58_9EUKA|nr:hypothetical protein PAPYR_4786 [Paratrimastix pyriformis]
MTDPVPPVPSSDIFPPFAQSARPPSTQFATSPPGTAEYLASSLPISALPPAPPSAEPVAEATVSAAEAAAPGQFEAPPPAPPRRAANPIVQLPALANARQSLRRTEGWNEQQSRVFALWINQQLKKTGSSQRIFSAASEMSDSLLITLIRMLTPPGMSLPVFHEPSRGAHEDRENIAMAHSFLVHKLGFNLTGITSSGLYNRQSTSVMGLTWLIIRRFLALSLAASPEEGATSGGAGSSTPEGTATTPAGKPALNDTDSSVTQRLLAWINQLLSPLGFPPLERLVASAVEDGRVLSGIVSTVC